MVNFQLQATDCPAQAPSLHISVIAQGPPRGSRRLASRRTRPLALYCATVDGPCNLPGHSRTKQHSKQRSCAPATTFARSTMPPKKRARLSQAASPEPEPQAKTPTPAAASPDEAALNNPWSDDEEIGLFKGLMRWKPTGTRGSCNARLHR